MKIVSGLFKGRVLKAPKTDKTRPSSEQLRAAVFNICQHDIEGSAFLDLFAGSGAMAFEALSRGASSATLVEQDREALKAIKANQDSLHVTIRVLPIDVHSALQKNLKKSQFTIIFMDPPYKMNAEPLIDLCAFLLNEGGHLFVEDRSAPGDVPEHCLHLKSCRRFGSSRLRHYIKISG